MMPRSRILLVFCISLLIGCGRNDRPTVHHTASEAQKSKSSTKSADSTANPATAAHATDHGENGGTQTAGKSDEKKATDANPADAKPLSKADEKPATDSGEKQGASGDAKKPPKADVDPTADTVKPPATPAPAAGTADSKATAASPPAGNITAPVPTGKPMPAGPTGKQAPHESEREIKIAGMRLLAPESWKRKKPRLKILIADFSVPGSKQESPEAQLTVTQSIKDDPKAIDQLRDAVKDEEKSKESTVTRLRIADHDVILVDSIETDDDSANPPSAGGNRIRSLNAMVFIGGSAFFVTCSGPEATVTERVGEFQEFLQTLKWVEQPR